jgi:hypothetical protein
VPLKGARSDAEPVQLSHQVQGTTLLRIIESNGLRQERRFALSSDDKLTLEVRVFSPGVTGSLTMTAVYRRI